MEWTNGLIFEFLDLYQNEPTLWNSTTPEHKNKNDAYDAWNRIKSKLKDGTIPIKEIKKKRDNLMSTYRRQRTKVKESMETSNGVDEVFKPEWPFYNIMATFLDDVYKPKNSKYYDDAQLSSGDNYSDLPTQDLKDDFKGTLERGLLDSHLSLHLSSADNNLEPSVDSKEAISQRHLLDSQLILKNTKHQSTKPRKRLHDDNSILSALQRLENISRVVHTQPTLTHPQDEFYFFALSVAAQLRNLPLHIAIETQSKIQNTLSSARLSSMINSNTPSTSSYNCNSPVCDQPPHSTDVQDTTHPPSVCFVEIGQGYSRQTEQFVPENIKQEAESYYEA